MNSDRALVLDLKVSTADSKVRRNILSIRSSSIQPDGALDQKSFTIKAGVTLQIPNSLKPPVKVLMYSKYPVTVSAKINDDLTPTILPGQKFFSFDGALTDIEITNTGAIDSDVVLIRLSWLDSIVYAVPIHLVSFPAFSAIAPLGFSVTTLANVDVFDVGFTALTNNQTVAPSSTGTLKFRICDADGTANPNGAYIMYLDTNVTNINSSGLLQLWVGERA